VLEVNTLPGMTGTSLLPRSAAAAGYTFSGLLDAIIEGSLRERGNGAGRSKGAAGLNAELMQKVDGPGEAGAEGYNTEAEAAGALAAPEEIGIREVTSHV
jgi:D-alanine-D-alanine ligase